MEASIDMNNNTLYNVKDPEEVNQATNKKYVDNQLGKKLDKTADIDMKNHSITNLHLSSNQRDTACVEFVNNRIKQLNETHISSSVKKGRLHGYKICLFAFFCFIFLQTSQDGSKKAIAAPFKEDNSKVVVVVVCLFVCLLFVFCFFFFCLLSTFSSQANNLVIALFFHQVSSTVSSTTGKPSSTGMTC